MFWNVDKNESVVSLISGVVIEVPFKDEATRFFLGYRFGEGRISSPITKIAINDKGQVWGTTKSRTYIIENYGEIHPDALYVFNMSSNKEQRDRKRNLTMDEIKELIIS